MANEHSPSDVPNAGKRPYRKPEIITEQLFEYKGLACTKIATGGAEDCEISQFPFGTNSTS